MASVQDFLTAVLPSPGHFYCVAELSSRRKEHAYVTSIADVISTINRFDQHNYNTYFALASFEQEGTREASNARYMRSFFIDIDLAEDENHYHSKEEAVAALYDFLDATTLRPLGMPWIVVTGGGLHAYWPLDADVPVIEWKPVAENLKRLAKKLGFKIDMSVPADTARVLRAPGTRNWKYESPRKVKLVVDGDTFTFDAFKAALKEKLNGDYYEPAIPMVAPINIPGRAPAAAINAGVLKIAEISEVSFNDIVARTARGDGCEQLAYYLTHAQHDGMEPMWRAMLSIAKYCTDGERAAKKLSALHPYDEGRMRVKLREIRGPYACKAIEAENIGGCDECKYRGKVTNPLALGRSLATDDAPKEVTLPVPDEALGTANPITVRRPDAPDGFAYAKAGGILVIQRKADDAGNMVETQKLVLPYDLFVVSILQSPEGEHVVHMLALRPTGPVQVVVPQRAIVSKDDTCKALAEQNIVATFGSGNDKNLFEYVRAAVEAASSGKLAVKVPGNYGWQADGTFVVSEKVYARGLPPVQVPMLALSNINKNTQPQGTLDNWRRVINMMVRKGLNEVLAMAMVGFAAPLMRFTGFYGMTFHIGSTQSGTGKTLALELAASVWGHPVHYRVGKKTSDVAMQQRLGMLNSLPLVCDEITDKNRKDFEWFPAFLFDMTEGRGKERMEANTNKERLNLSTWQTLSLMSSNTHVVDYLSGARKHSSEGELRRLLELTMETPLAWTEEELSILKLLGTNYGVAGQQYAQYLVDNTDTCQRIVHEAQEYVFREFKATNDERFWVAGVAAVLAAVVLIGNSYARIVDVPRKGVEGVMRGLISHARGNVKSNVRSAEDVLNAYTRDFYGSLIIVRQLNGVLSTTLGDNGVIDQSTTRSKIYGRVEHLRADGTVDYFIEEQLLKSYCSSMSFGYADFKRQLAARYGAMATKRDLTKGTKGPPMRVNVLHIPRPVEDEEA